MNETYERLVHFRSALAAFLERGVSAQREVERIRDTLAAQWQDSTRHWHDEHWLPHEEGLWHFLAREGPEMLEFLDTKIRALKEYLDG